jgi:sugar phosphate permease
MSLSLSFFQMSKWFCDTSTGAATGATRCGSFVGGGLVSWSLAIDEHSGLKDLRGLGHQSIIPYVHGRTELYCSACMSLSLSFFFTVNLFSTPRKRYLPGPFIAQGRVVTMRPGARQVAPMWLKLYTTSRTLMTRSS